MSEKQIVRRAVKGILSLDQRNGPLFDPAPLDGRMEQLARPRIGPCRDMTAIERLDGQQDRRMAHDLFPGYGDSADEMPILREKVQHGAARLPGLRDISPRNFVHNVQYDEPVFRFRRTVASVLPDTAGQTEQPAQKEGQPSSAEQISSRIHDPF